MNIKLIDAVKQVLEEDPRTKNPKYSWLFFVKVLRKMDYKIFIDFETGMPSPETIFRERREVLNKKNKYSDTFVKEEGVTYENSSKK